jgi:hypothetical protein
MKFIVMLLVCFLAFTATAQKVDWKKLSSLQPDRELQAANRPPTPVLLLGTFHFNYPQADAHKTDSSRFINVLSTQRQKELQELTEVILRFRPTRVYIESSRQSFHDSLYGAFRGGQYQLGRNEIYQVGYRVAGALNHPKVYAVDAQPFSQENYKKYTWIDSLWKERVYVDPLRDQYWNQRYKQFYDTGDSIATTLTMLENFLLMAEPAVLFRMHGHYLAGGFNTQSHTGPDALSLWWYNRNLRIFNSILKTKPNAQDRILVLFGNGHMPILKHCFQSSPEFQVVELKSLLR